MKYVMRMLVLTCLLVPSTIFAQSVVGSWKMSVPTEDGGTMAIKVVISAEGTYTVDFGADGAVEVKGEYQFSNGQMTIKDVSGGEACTGVGVYKAEVSGDTMKMTRVSDACPDRGGPDGVMVFNRA